MLTLNPTRTWTKAQWREVHRWLRLVNWELQAEVAKRMSNLLVYGTSHPEIFR